MATSKLKDVMMDMNKGYSMRLSNNSMEQLQEINEELKRLYPDKRSVPKRRPSSGNFSTMNLRK